MLIGCKVLGTYLSTDRTSSSYLTGPNSQAATKKGHAWVRSIRTIVVVACSKVLYGGFDL